MGPLVLQAGGFSADHSETKKKESSGDWCETLQDFGTLYNVKKEKTGGSIWRIYVGEVTSLHSFDLF